METSCGLCGKATDKTKDYLIHTARATDKGFSDQHHRLLQFSDFREHNFTVCNSCYTIWDKHSGKYPLPLVLISIGSIIYAFLHVDSSESIFVGFLIFGIICFVLMFVIASLSVENRLKDKAKAAHKKSTDGQGRYDAFTPLEYEVLEK